MGVGTNETLKIYVRLPVRIEEELQVKNLHPDIQVVKLPRQKSRRWCFVEFADKETLDRVVKHLQTIKINDKKIVVKRAAQRQLISSSPADLALKSRREVLQQ